MVAEPDLKPRRAPPLGVSRTRPLGAAGSSSPFSESDTLARQMRKSAAKPPSLSRRTRPFQESVIREMTRIGAEVGGVNLAQGLPDFDPPAELLDALPGILSQTRHHQYSRGARPSSGNPWRRNARGSTALP